MVLLDNVLDAVKCVTKAVATEIKNLNSPPADIKAVIVTVADFIDGHTGNTWNTARAKMFDYVRRGVGTKQSVTP